MNSPSLPHDIFELWDYPAWLLPWWIFGLAILLFALILYLLLRKQAKENFSSTKDWCQHLKALEVPDNWSPEGAKEFYFDISYALRAVLEQLKLFSATDMTSHEIKLTLAKHEDKISADGSIVLLQLLGQADRVKFANEIPSQERALADLKNAQKLIQRLLASIEGNSSEKAYSRGVGDVV